MKRKSMPGLMVYLWVLGLVLAQPATGEAGTQIFPISTYLNITSDEGYSLILIEFAPVDSLPGRKILYAKCQLNIDLDTCVQFVEDIQISPLRQQWSADSVGWRDAVGNVDEDTLLALSCFSQPSPGRNGFTEILLTSIVQSWADGKLENHGLVLISRNQDCNVSYDEVENQDKAKSGRLIVKSVSLER
jgi:hypothetical protein